MSCLADLQEIFFVLSLLEHFTRSIACISGAPHFSQIVRNILGSAWITFLCILCYRFGPGQNFDAMIIGGIILMVPGVAFTNAIPRYGRWRLYLRICPHDGRCSCIFLYCHRGRSCHRTIWHTNRHPAVAIRCTFEFFANKNAEKSCENVCA